MEVFRFIQSFSTPLISVGLKHGKPHHPQLAHIATVPYSDFPTIVTIESAGNVRESEGNWVLKILRVGSFWERWKEGPGGDEEEEDEIEDEGDGCSVEEAKDRVEFDRDSFSRFLSCVSLPEAEIYVKLSYLSKLAYAIPKIKELDVLVHRGIYEAAKGIYQPMLAEVQAYLKNKGKSATFRFTGHSLGGSLALLVNFMLLVRGDAPHSSLLPVVTFGAPFIMCGGDSLLRKVGLPHSHVQSIMMHRDIVPRAFSCQYPDQVSKILKAVNRNFRNHPCLKNQNLLYTPMGDLLILQPDEKYSPHHDLLPVGTGLYFMGHYSSEVTEASMKRLNSARFVFLNSPHPLEVLSDSSAYGSEGTIFRDHDINAYLRSILAILRKEHKNIKKSKRENERLIRWPFLPAQAVLSALVRNHSIKQSKTNRH